MNFFQKVSNKLTGFFKFLMGHKLILLILLPVIALAVTAAILLGRVGDGPDDPEQGGESSTTLATTEATEGTTEATDPLQTTLGTLGSSGSSSSEVQTEQTTEPRDPDVPLILERKDLINIHATTDDGIILMTGELEIPVFSNRNENPAITLINDSVFAYVSELREEIVKECRPIAENDLTSDSPSIPFNCGVTAEVTLSSDTCVSILFSTWIYTGGENSSVYREAVTYSLADGSVCEFSDLFGGYTDTVSEMVRDRVIDEIAAAPEEFYPDYEGLVDFYPIEERWYLSESEGLCVFYVPYELAGYAKNVLTYSIPFGELNTYLVFNPAYTSFAE